VTSGHPTAKNATGNTHRKPMPSGDWDAWLWGGVVPCSGALRFTSVDRFISCRCLSTRPQKLLPILGAASDGIRLGSNRPYGAVRDPVVTDFCGRVLRLRTCRGRSPLHDFPKPSRRFAAQTDPSR